LPPFSNSKDDKIMATRKLTPEDLHGIQEFAKQWGKIISRRAFGELGPGLDVDLAQMEQVAHAAAQGLTAGVLEATTGQQATQMGLQQPCPKCGKLCSVGWEERPIDALGGPFLLHEPTCYCPTCRRDFFPSASRSEARHARLQPDNARQNHVGGRPPEIA
jgi:hypothetical protein